ncbi:hypothetical protein CYMTET_13017 [Cymbomonas tetramitiformis]|uniref:Uncharacterized protein n=1 Tax=Cymbomonas tetramitiformis TaxID=36881 RepID=A0AAE0GKJ0_9CHLO|nr:hypothetical protein CYMTET_13017 [Cymbomonas tetramitiformis]
MPECRCVQQYPDDQERKRRDQKMRKEEHSVLRYLARVDPWPILLYLPRSTALFANKAVEWNPTEATRRHHHLFERLDPDFYNSAVRDRYLLPSDLLAVTFKMLALLVTAIPYTI